MKSRYTIGFASLTCILAGCSTTDLSSPGMTADVAQSAAAQIVARPWSGECNVTAQFLTESTLRITGNCQLAHLGRATVVEYQTITPGPDGIAYTNTAVYTASDGDELHTTNVGVALPNATGLALSGIETAVGGTGRFENATGTARLEGAVRFTGPFTTEGSYRLDGSLTF